MKAFYFETPNSEPMPVKVLDIHNGQYKIEYKIYCDRYRRVSYFVDHETKWVDRNKIMEGIANKDIAFRIYRLEEEIKRLEEKLDRVLNRHKGKGGCCETD